MNFNKNQQEVINTINGNIAVIATAGSGKTSTLTYRIKNMVQNHNIPPHSILAVTFSKKAKEAIDNKLKSLDVNYVNVETFHSLALKIIKSAYGNNTYTVWTAYWEKEKTLQEICVNRLNICDKENVPYNELLFFISKQKNGMLKPNDKLIYDTEYSLSNETLQSIYKLYEEYKNQKHYIEFDDFLNLANDALDENKELLKSYRNKFQYILADEFQDISLSQSLLLKKLNDKNTMIVGDPLQAIYSFRGGNSSFILNFDNLYDDAKIINLNVNYRCSQNIVQTANMLAKDIPDSLHKHYVESIANNGAYTSPIYNHYENDYIEAEAISKKILELKSKYNYKDIAVLARTNAQLQKIETALHSKNTPFSVVDGQLFTELPEIKLLISYLKLSLNTNNDEAFMYLYNKPNRWLDKKFLEETKENAVNKNISLYESMFTILRRNWRFKNGINEIESVIRHLKNTKFENIGEELQYLRKILNIDDYVTKGKQADDGSFIEQIENMNTFQDIAKDFTSLVEFINYLDDINKKIDKESDKVQLLTIHKSKGLEFPVVFIIGCSEGLLPHAKSDNIQDEKRLFYVAITRAEKELYLSSISSYNSNLLDPSLFLNSIKSTITNQTEIPKNYEQNRE